MPSLESIKAFNWRSCLFQFIRIVFSWRETSVLSGIPRRVRPRKDCFPNVDHDDASHHVQRCVYDTPSPCKDPICVLTSIFKLMVYYITVPVLTVLSPPITSHNMSRLMLRSCISLCFQDWWMIPTSIQEQLNMSWTLMLLMPYLPGAPSNKKLVPSSKTHICLSKGTITMGINQINHAFLTTWCGHIFKENECIHEMSMCSTCIYIYICDNMLCSKTRSIIFRSIIFAQASSVPYPVESSLAPSLLLPPLTAINSASYHWLLWIDENDNHGQYKLTIVQMLGVPQPLVGNQGCKWRVPQAVWKPSQGSNQQWMRIDMALRLSGLLPVLQFVRWAQVAELAVLRAATGEQLIKLRSWGWKPCNWWLHSGLYPHHFYTLWSHLHAFTVVNLVKALVRWLAQCGPCLSGSPLVSRTKRMADTSATRRFMHGGAMVEPCCPLRLQRAASMCGRTRGRQNLVRNPWEPERK